MVVLPFVPVMPTIVSRSDGRPATAAASGPIAARTDATWTSATPRPNGRSHSSATAPCATACGGEVVAVGDGAGHAGEQRAGHDVARVVVDAGDVDVVRAGHPAADERW